MFRKECITQFKAAKLNTGTKIERATFRKPALFLHVSSKASWLHVNTATQAHVNTVIQAHMNTVRSARVDPKALWVLFFF